MDRETLTDDQIRERDGYRCARCGGTSGGLHVHHRFMRSAGADERACNRVTLCSYCHRWCHNFPAKARTEGWLIFRHGTDPAQVQVRHWMWPSWPVLLEPAGGITPVIDDDVIA